MKLSNFFSVGLVAGLMVVGSGMVQPTKAATQILGVIATLDPVPMACVDGICTAQLSSFCLQKERNAPGYGIHYEFQTADQLRLWVVSVDGSIATRDVGHDVTIMTERGYSSVTVSLAETVIDELGGGFASLVVPQSVSALPVPIENDKDPLVESEIAYVTGPLRNLAIRVVEHDKRRTVAAQVTNQLINTLPRTSRMSATQRLTLWDDAMGNSVLASDEPGVLRAKDIYGACRELTGQGNTFFFKRCLESRHDDLMNNVNMRYWQRAGSGV